VGKEISEADVARFLNITTRKANEDCMKLAKGVVINGKVDTKTLYSRMPKSTYEDSIKLISDFTGQSYENVFLETKKIDLPSSSPSTTSNNTIPMFKPSDPWNF
jgi:hypothetical protein